MLKRNKLSIFLVLVVIGLTIYYVKTPTKAEKPKEDTTTSSERYPLYAQSRLEVLTERNEEIAKYETTIAEASSTNEENDAYERLTALTKLTEREVGVEYHIKGLGYSDCFVHTSGNRIKVNVLSNNFSVEDFVEVALLVKGEFGNDYQVIVNVDTPSN